MARGRPVPKLGDRARRAVSAGAVGDAVAVEAAPELRHPAAGAMGHRHHDRLATDHGAPARKLEAEITAQPIEERDRFRILQIKEKFGRLTVYTADSTPDMDTAIQAAADESTRICEVCGAPGELKERNFWRAPRCTEHE